MTDPIADMLTQVRNAILVNKSEVLLPHSNFKQRLADLLRQQGLIEETFVVNHGKQKVLGMKLRYIKGKPIIGGLKRVSKPGQRIYVNAKTIPRTQSGFGVTILSTPKGLMSDKDARKANIGGEVVCQIW